MAETKRRAQFSELNDEQKKIVSHRCFNVAIECNFRGSLIENKYHFASKQFILDKADYYYTNYASATEKVKYIKLKNEYENLSKSNGIYYRSDTKYQQYIEAIYGINDMEELDEYIKGNNPSSKPIPLHSLNLAISDRSRALGDKDGIYKAVKEKLLEYGKYKYDKKKKINDDKSKLTLEENKLLSKLTLMDFLSGEEIYKKDYCKRVGISVNTFDKRSSLVKEYDIDYYKEFEKNLDEKRQNYYTSLTPVVETILDNLENNKEYNIIDYYLNYKDLYTFNDLCLSCNKSNLDIRKLKTFFSRVDVKNSLSKDAFISSHYEVNNHVFAQDEKEEIYNYAKENSIPFNWTNVSLLVARNKNKYLPNKTNR